MPNLKGLIVICFLFLAATVSNADQAEYSCESIESIPKAERCKFVTENCELDSRLPYTQWYYCSVQNHSWLVRGMFVLVLLLLLPLLFTALGDTAELYFSPTMTLIAQTIPGMRPRFAGVTFVAVGNGAPDLSANISALRSGQVSLSAGAFTGAAMFVQCIVASEVIRISGGVKCRGATLRDVGVYAVSVSGVCLALYYGKVSHWFVAGCSLTYFLYVAWVFLGDEWHARGRPDLRPDVSWHQVRDLLLRRQYHQMHHRQDRQGSDTGGPGRYHTSVNDRNLAAAMDDYIQPDLQFDGSGEPGVTEALLPWASLEGAAAAGQQPPAGRELNGPSHPFSPTAANIDTEQGLGPGTQPRMSTPDTDTDRGYQARHGSGILGSHTYQQAVWADLGWEPTSTLRRQLVAGRDAPPPSSKEPAVAQPIRQVVMTDMSRPASRSGPSWQQQQEDEHQSLYAEPSAYTPPMVSLHEDTSVDDGVHDAAQQQEGRDGSPHEQDVTSLDTRTWKQQLWDSACSELTLGASEEWCEMPHWQRKVRQTTFAALFPVYGLLRLTVPQIDPDTYSQQWLTASCLCSPLAVLVYFNALSVGSVIAAMIIGASLAVGMHLVTKDEPEMPRLDCGTSVAIGPALVSLLGFFMGVLWIDTLASEVVGVVSFFSSLFRLPPSLVGLTFLAWGSSLGDFFGNPAMARRGASSTALTACFAGPLFNMLLSMALGFSAYFAKERISSAVVSLPPDAALGCIALVLYNIILAVIGIMNNYKLPERFYLFSRAWYALYLLIAGAMALRTASL